MDKEYSIVEIPTPPQLVGKSLIELDLRRRFGINVVGIRSYLQAFEYLPDAEYKIQKEDHLVVIADCKTLDRFDVLDRCRCENCIFFVHNGYTCFQVCFHILF